MQKGLTGAQAARLLEKHGENVLDGESRQSAVSLFASQFKDLLTLILLCGAVISLLLGEYIDAVTIMAIVFLNAVLGFAQEYRTERTLEHLKAMSAPKAAVIRDGVKAEIPAAALVPGDVVLISAGSRVPADGSVLVSAELCADESLLTGESLPVSKTVFHGGGDPGALRNDFVYMGTVITAGHGEFLVTQTGMSTQMGRIAGLLKNTKAEPTPLQKKLGVLSRYIALGCILICLIVTATGILRGEPVFDMFLTGISLSVAAIPEGLTAVITISLGLAVSRMLRRNALVRRLHSVETLGCADVICSDKTGTLTENRMTVTEVYLPDGRVIQAENFRSELPALRELFTAAVLCNNAEMGPRGVSGEPTEAALLKMAADCGFLEEARSLPFRRSGEIPFDSARKLMSVSAVSGGKTFVFTKGAPDVLLPLCENCFCGGAARPMTQSDLLSCQRRLSAMAGSALRVLAIAFKEAPSSKITEDGLTFLGFCGMIDPPRAGAKESVLKCKRAGVRTVMITGDHPETALAIAKQLGIASSAAEIRTGKELDSLSEKEFSGVVEAAAVFARVTPAHKLKIVRALKKNGHIVAMTGDGVNDAPAVKEADIGVSMGKNGTDVTREASGIVLLDDDFSTLVSAVEEGRIIYQNIRKFIRYLLACNIGEVVTMFFGMLMGMPVILLPIQILMVNLVTDGIPAIALSLDPPQDDVMTLKPRKREESVFSGGLAFTIVTRGLLLGLSVLMAFTTVLSFTNSLESARTAAFVTLVFTQLVHVFECKSEDRSLFTINILNNVKLILAGLSSAAIILMTVYVPSLHPVFKTVALGQREMLTVLAATLAVPALSSVIMFIRHGR